MWVDLNDSTYSNIIIIYFAIVMTFTLIVNTVIMFQMKKIIKVLLICNSALISSDTHASFVEFAKNQGISIEE